MRPLVLINLVIAFIATTAPLAHVLEMASKLSLDGPLWLAIQHNLYRGWGDVFGPVEILALLTSLWLLAWSRNHTPLFRTYLIATACYGLMLACFFVFNAPVNDALNGWTAATLPQDWTVYRIRWEAGHALSAILAVIAFVTLLRAHLSIKIAAAGNAESTP